MAFATAIGITFFELRKLLLRSNYEYIIAAIQLLYTEAQAKVTFS